MSEGKKTTNQSLMSSDGENTGENNTSSNAPRRSSSDFEHFEVIEEEVLEELADDSGK